MKKITVIAEGGGRFGMGHVVRSFTLCQNLNILSSVNFFLKTETQNSINLSSKLYFKNTSIIHDEMDCFNDIESNSIVIIDGYNFNIRSINKITSHKKLNLICIADVQKEIPNCKVLINHLPWVNSEDYKNYNVEKFLLGPNYAIIRPVFFSKKIKSSGRFLICLGNTSVDDEIKNIYKELIKKGIKDELIDIIYNKSIKGLNKKVHSDLNSIEVFKFISKSEYCFITPGNFSYEVFKVNRKCILGSVSKSQVIPAEEFGKMNLCINVGKWSKANYKLMDSWLLDSSKTIEFQRKIFVNLKKGFLKKQFNNLTI